jgi:hypothetical protein
MSFARSPLGQIRSDHGTVAWLANLVNSQTLYPKTSLCNSQFPQKSKVGHCNRSSPIQNRVMKENFQTKPPKAGSKN